MADGFSLLKNIPRAILVLVASHCLIDCVVSPRVLPDDTQGDDTQGDRALAAIKNAAR